jgi:UDP-glucuronate 4-epimerase
MKVLLTGAAGFVGYHVARALCARGDHVTGVDNVNDYYDVALKRARLRELSGQSGFDFVEMDIADPAFADLVADLQPETVVHLAAQAGVRYSQEHPQAYVRSNLAGHVAVLEACRRLDRLTHLVYASSSSVYGANQKVPFAESDRVDEPVSLYAATKRADELMSLVYADLYRIPQTGLRLFTVYGPWGRPDMAYYIFTENILNGRPIRLFNNGKLSRDFTYIDDAVRGILGVLDRPPSDPPHRILNIGNEKPVALEDFLSILEKLIGRTATVERVDMQPGDVPRTCADISAIRALTGYAPATDLEAGLRSFVDWYRGYRGSAAGPDN